MQRRLPAYICHWCTLHLCGMIILTQEHTARPAPSPRTALAAVLLPHRPAQAATPASQLARVKRLLYRYLDNMYLGISRYYLYTIYWCRHLVLVRAGPHGGHEAAAGLARVARQAGQVQLHPAAQPQLLHAHIVNNSLQSLQLLHCKLQECDIPAPRRGGW